MRRLFPLLAALLLHTPLHAETIVSAAAKPDGPWLDRPTREIGDLPGFKPGETVALDQYGGLAGKTIPGAAGFFRTQKVGDRWWLVDPEGHAFFHVGVASVNPGSSPRAKAAFATKFGGLEAWAAATGKLLHDAGFNGTGAWTTNEALRATPKPFVYTQIWNFMSTYGRKRGGTFQQPGHRGYPGGCIFVFDPDFEKFCDEHARQLAATKDDPWLLGHFSDNELPFTAEALDQYLALPKGDPGQVAAQEWLAKQKGHDAAVAEITAADRAGFLQVVAEHYFRTVSTAIRKYDPNHLYLGSRFHGRVMRLEPIFRAARPYLDLVSVNYYGGWSPDAQRLRDWDAWFGKPFMITEWYAKGMDVGLANTGGAGWTVKTQKERALFYTNFALGLLEAKNCVGWHWFKYQDNDPSDTGADPSNRDSNKGVVNADYVPYPTLVGAMTSLNHDVYSLISYFDQHPAPAPKP